MNFKSLLKSACYSMLVSLALADKSALKGDCKKFADVSSECTVNSEGKITQISISGRYNDPCDDVLEKLSSQKAIKYLAFEYGCQNEVCKTPIEDILNVISTFSNLKELHFNYKSEYTGMAAHTNYIQNIQDGFFKNLKNLKVLDLTNIDLSQENIEEIGALSKLKELDLTNCDYYDVDFSPLAKLSKLTTFNANVGYKKGIKDRYEYYQFNSKHLKSLKNLKKLSLDCNETCKLSKKDISQLKKLEEANLSHLNLTQDIIDGLGSLKNLHSINFDSCCNIKLNFTPIKRRYNETGNCRNGDEDGDEDVDEVIPISTNGKCGKEYGRCPSGECCSQYGYCGVTSEYCGKKCQSEFGDCN